MLGYYVDDIAQRLATRQENEGWQVSSLLPYHIQELALTHYFPAFQEIEATLHCIMSVQEAMDLEKTPHLGRLFSPDILGRLPSAGHGRIRRTTLGVIGRFCSPQPCVHTLI